MDIEPFIREIIANPADDVARLVFADYLEQHGDARGELIRIQFQILDAEKGSKEHRKLRKRERELAKEHGAFGRAPQGVKPLGARGGFLDAIEVTVARFLRLQEKIFEMAPIRSVVLKGRSVKLAKVGESPYLGQLREFRMSQNYAAEDDLVSVLRSSKFDGLEALQVGSTGLPVSAIQSIATNSRFESLRTLAIHGRVPDRSPAGSLTDSEYLQNLTTLSLSIPRLGDGFLTRLAAAPQFGSLENLTVYGQPSGVGLREILQNSHLTQLRSLRFAGQSQRQQTDAVRDALSDGGNLKRLRLLALQCPLDAECIRRIAEHCLELDTLELPYCRIGSAGAEAIAVSPFFGRLERLVLTGSDIGFRGCVALAESPYRQKRTKIYLRNSRLSRRDVKRLKANYGKTFGNLGNPRAYG